MSLVVVDVVIVESLRVASHVPLADDGCLIACILQQFGEECARCVDTLAQLSLSVLMTVKSGHQTCTRRSGERILDKRLVKTHTALGYTVDVGRGCELANGVSICRNALESMVVAHDVHNVGALCCSLLLCLHCGCEARKGCY